MTKCYEMWKSIRFDVNLICSCCTNKRGAAVALNAGSNVNDVMNKYFCEVQKTYDCFNIETSRREGGINGSCFGCYKLREKPETFKDLKINTINIANWRQCNLKCIYCCFKNEKYINAQYDVFPYIKYLAENDKLSDETQVIIAGGEPSVLNNIDSILDLFSLYENIKIYMLSNMLIFRKSYIKLLKNGNLYINTSIDSSEKKMYKYIHSFDKFDIVIKNLKTALKYAKDKKQVKIKYILLEGVNDKQEYVDAFIKLALKLKIVQVQYDFNREEDNFNKKIPENIIELYEYAKTKSQKNGLFVDLDPRSESMSKTHIYI